MLPAMNQILFRLTCIMAGLKVPKRNHDDGLVRGRKPGPSTDFPDTFCNENEKLKVVSQQCGAHPMFFFHFDVT